MQRLAFPRALLFALALVVAGGLSCRSKAEPATPLPGAAVGGDTAAVTLGVEDVAVVQELALRDGPLVSGTLEPVRHATIRAEVGGAILEVGVDTGAAVTQGQLLARIEDAAASDQLRAAQSSVRTATHALAVAELNLSRSRSLAAAGGLPRHDVEQAELSVAAEQSQVAEARARLASATTQMSRTRVLAPFDGVVALRNVAAGDVVAPGGELFEIVDPSTMRLEASVPADNLGALRQGTSVVFGVSAYPGKDFVGQIEAVSPVVDRATGQGRLLVQIPNPEHALFGGLFAQGRVVTQEKTALGVPADAIDLATNPPSVMRLAGGRAQRVEVEVGMRDSLLQRMELRAGVVPGDLLVRAPARAALVDGAAVCLAEDPAKIVSEATAEAAAEASSSDGAEDQRDTGAFGVGGAGAEQPRPGGGSPSGEGPSNGGD